jgi:uncharacterized SAM-binding protein YcdF (DUF218 family)
MKRVRIFLLIVFLFLFFISLLFLSGKIIFNFQDEKTEKESEKMF